MVSSIDDVSNRLGQMEATVEHVEKRLDKIDAKQDAMLEKLAVIDHMRRNIAMMKEPVEEYQRLKQRGMGMWALIMFVIGAGGVVINLVSYIIRAGVLNIQLG